MLSQWIIACMSTKARKCSVEQLPIRYTPDMKKPAMSPKGNSKTDSSMDVKRKVKRSSWQLVFESSSMAGQACKLLQKANKEKQFCQPGTAPAVHDKTVLLQWRFPSLHYSVRACLYRHESATGLGSKSQEVSLDTQAS
jgi:hypothetical protein